MLPFIGPELIAHFLFSPDSGNRLPVEVFCLPKGELTAERDKLTYQDGTKITTAAPSDA
jgi:hypothetical protein